MADKEVWVELADGVGLSIEQRVREVARDGHVAVPGLIFEKVLAQNLDSKLPPLEVSEAVLRSAGSRVQRKAQTTSPGVRAIERAKGLR